MAIEQQTEILDNVVVVHLDVSLWSGRKKLRPEDLKAVSGREIPPEDLASLGSKKIVDPRETRQFERLKRQGERACAKRGVRFMGGYAVPEEQLADLRAELQRIGAEFQETKRSFLDRYNQLVQAWMAEHPDWSHIIARAVSPETEVAQRLDFRYQLFRIQPATDDPGTEANAGLAEETRGLAGRLFQEVATEARQLWKGSVDGRSELTQKIRRPLTAMVDKLRGLAFLDRRVNPLVRSVEQTLEALPRQGKIQGQDFYRMVGVIQILTSPEWMKAQGQAVLDGNEPIILPEHAGALPQGEGIGETSNRPSEADHPLAQTEGTEPAASREALDPPPSPQGATLPNGWFT